MTKDNEIKIPEGLNLKSPSVDFSDNTKELIEEAFQNRKIEQFYCDSHKKLTTYIQCLSNCPDREKCGKFKEIEVKLEEYEFLMDLSE